MSAYFHCSGTAEASACKVQHPRDTVLFDTGMHPTLGTDPAARLGPQAGLWTVALGADARRLIDGEHDLFGDGRVVCVPTHGHTPGHQSLRLRLDDGRDVLFTADACYLRESLVARRLPPFGHDPVAMRTVLDRLDALAAGGTELVFGHDPEQWPAVAARLV